MKIPENKDTPKLPPAKGGGAAARQHQFEIERGLANEELPEEPKCNEPDAVQPAGKKQKKPKPKS